MKTSVKLKLKASQLTPQSGVLAMRITRHRATRTTTTSCVLSSDEWDERKQKIIFSENISSKRKKELSAIERKLKKDLKEVHETLGILEAHGDYTSQELVRRFRERQEGQMFCTFVGRRVENLRSTGRFGTAHACRYAAVSFLKFLKGQDIRIDKITAALMEEYERYLLAGNRSKNTVSCYMRSLRAAYNLAVREKILVVKKERENPFSRVFTGNARTEKRAVSVESISKLMNEAAGNNEAATHSLSFSRDLFLFSLSTQGMSFTDMASLKKENIGEKFIRYKRRKTGQSITIELEDCMREIIERYADSGSEFVFPILRAFENTKGFGDYERWKKTANALTVYNRNLKKLAALAGLSEHFTSYAARHSWATLASQEGIPIATISRGMGHESEKTTRIYISQIDYSDVGHANRQILSRIFSHKPQKPHTPKVPERELERKKTAVFPAFSGTTPPFRGFWDG